MGAVGQADRAGGPADLLHRDAMRQVAQVRASVLFLDRDPQQSQIAHLRPPVLGKLVVAVDLRGARRYLKPDGRLIISTPNIALWFYRLSLLVGRFEYGPRGVLDETHVHLYTGSTFRREVENAGFDVLRQRVTALPFEVVFESTGRSRLVRGIASAYHLLARLWPSMFAYQYVLEARITTLDEESTTS